MRNTREPLTIPGSGRGKNKVHVYVSELEALKSFQPITVNVAEIGGQDLLLLSRAFDEWEKLKREPAFLRDIRIEWLDFWVFLDDVGLPPRTDFVLGKSDEYLRYAAYSVFWTQEI